MCAAVESSPPAEQVDSGACAENRRRIGHHSRNSPRRIVSHDLVDSSALSKPCLRVRRTDAGARPNTGDCLHRHAEKNEVQIVVFVPLTDTKAQGQIGCHSHDVSGTKILWHEGAEVGLIEIFWKA